MSDIDRHHATVREYLMKQVCSQEHHDALASLRALRDLARQRGGGCGLRRRADAAMVNALAALAGSVNTPADREAILAEVSAERDRQDAKWGGVPGTDRRDDHTYAAVLGEEFGECCQAWLQRDTVALRTELVQTAAVAVAWVEELDNGGMRPRPAAPSSGEPA